MKKIVYFFYPHLANDVLDVPGSAARDGTVTNYINKNNENKNKN